VDILWTTVVTLRHQVRMGRVSRSADGQEVSSTLRFTGFSTVQNLITGSSQWLPNPVNAGIVALNISHAAEHEM
jgi:hypothetical protein